MTKSYINKKCYLKGKVWNFFSRPTIFCNELWRFDLLERVNTYPICKSRIQCAVTTQNNLRAINERIMVECGRAVGHSFLVHVKFAHCWHHKPGTVSNSIITSCWNWSWMTNSFGHLEAQARYEDSNDKLSWYGKLIIHLVTCTKQYYYSFRVVFWVQCLLLASTFS